MPGTSFVNATHSISETFHLTHIPSVQHKHQTIPILGPWFSHQCEEFVVCHNVVLWRGLFLVLNYMCLQRETEEKARQPETKLSAIAQTRHIARLRDAKRSRTRNPKSISSSIAACHLSASWRERASATVLGDSKGTRRCWKHGVRGARVSSFKTWVQSRRTGSATAWG
jgi:hypothetical protein